jgi:hypothetical protein
MVGQIPWIFDSRLKKSLEPSKPKSAISIALPTRMVVVADIFGRHRPNFKNLQHAIRLFFPTSRMRIQSSPFGPLPKMPIQQKMLADGYIEFGGPPEEGYCELCQQTFERGEYHHLSGEHRRHNTQQRWHDFDDLAASISQKNVL